MPCPVCNCSWHCFAAAVSELHLPERLQLFATLAGLLSKGLELVQMHQMIQICQKVSSKSTLLDLLPPLLSCIIGPHGSHVLCKAEVKRCFS